MLSNARAGETATVTTTVPEPSCVAGTPAPVYMVMRVSTMIAALPIFDIFTGKQAGNIFCLNDQPNIACFMIIRGV